MPIIQFIKESSSFIYIFILKEFSSIKLKERDIYNELIIQNNYSNETLNYLFLSMITI